MPILPRLFSFWRNLVHRDRVDGDLEEEIRTAFESVVKDQIRAGVQPEDARRAATLEFGAIEGVKERVRDARTGAWFDVFKQDVHTVANTLLLRAASGVTEPDRLLDIFRTEEGKTLANFTTSYPYYLDIRQRTTTLAIVSETTARYLWPGQDAIGNYIIWHEVRPEQAGPPITLQVIGIVPDLTSPFAAAQRGGRRRRLATSWRPWTRTCRSCTPQPLDAQTGPVYLQIRVAASVAAIVGFVGLLLAAIGVYGVTAYTTFCRTREIGVRIALGAQRGNVVGMVLRQGMSLVVVGTIIGLVLAAAGRHMFDSWLAGMPALDPITLGGAATLSVLVGLAACYVPAQRATRIDAMEALRYE